MPGQVPPGMGGGFGGMGQAFPQQQPGFGGAPGGMPGQPGQFGAAQPFNPQSAMGNPLAALEAYERQDFGVPPSTMLHGGAMHAPTPTQVPGGQVITTAQLVQMVQGGMRPVIVDVLGSQQSLPGAIPAPMGGAGGSFQDGNQAQFVGLLQQATGGDPSRPLVIYCLNPQCWLSYNATLRAVNAGFRQVLWYRGGIESWAQAGLPLMAAGQQPGFGAGGMPGAPAMPGMAAPGFTGAGPGGGFGGQGGKPPPR
jgi:PQQ-dependent catabolism-associated CXXCW motif protein